MRRGGTLVTVRADPAQASMVMDILEQHGSVDLDQMSAGWRREGWKPCGPDSVPTASAPADGRTRVRTYPGGGGI